MARNTRSAFASTTHQRGRPGRSMDHRRSPSNPRTWSWGALVLSPMQATTATCKDEAIATPFGRGPVLRTARISSVCTSTQAKIALPRFVTRTEPFPATTPAASGKPRNVAICWLVSASTTSRLFRAVCAIKTRRVSGSKAPWSNDVPSESGISIVPAAVSDITTPKRFEGKANSQGWDFSTDCAALFEAGCRACGSVAPFATLRYLI